MEGWIKLHRISLDHWLYKTKKPKTRREAWEDMLILVNYEPKKSLIRGQLYECDRGQSLFSLETWAKQFNWSVQMVRTFFKLLENDKMITLEGLQYTTRLTICNYDTYQGYATDEQQAKQQTNNRPLTDEQQTANRPLTTTKEYKEVKKEKNYIPEAIFLNEFCINYFDEKYVNENSLKTFDELIRLDKYSVDQIKSVIVFARQDDFWKKNFISPNKLRSKDKHGVKYMDVFLAKLPESTNKHKYDLVR